MSETDTRTRYQITEHTAAIGIPIEPGEEVVLRNATLRPMLVRVGVPGRADARGAGRNDQFALRHPSTFQFLRSVGYPGHAGDGLHHVDATDLVSEARKFASVADAVCWAESLADAWPSARTGILNVVRIDGRTGKCAETIGSVADLNKAG